MAEMAMKDIKTAADLRRVIESIAKKVVDRERPDTRQGRVYSFNTETNTAMVLFPGNTIEGLVPVTFGKNMIPSVAMETTFAVDGYSAAGDVVRVAGKPNDWYVVGFSVGLPVSEHTQLSGINFDFDFLNVTSLGNQVIVLTHVPILESVHVYWGGVFLPDFDWTLSDDGLSITVYDPDERIKIGRLLTAKYAWIEDEQTPAPPVDPQPDIIIDLPAWHVTDTGGGGDFDDLSTMDTSTEMAIQPAGHIGVGYFAESDQGAIVSGHWIYMPVTPDGYELASATYVAIAYAEEDDGDYTGTPFSNYYPSPSNSPYLNAESSGTIDNYVIEDLPIGAYSGEQVWSLTENLSRLTAAPGSQFPCLRLWNEWANTFSATNYIHVAYYAVRLTYTWVG